MPRIKISETAYCHVMNVRALRRISDDVKSIVPGHCGVTRKMVDDLRECVGEVLARTEHYDELARDGHSSFDGMPSMADMDAEVTADE